LYDIFLFFLIQIFYFYSSELVRCYMDANNIDKARDVSTQLLQLCQTKQLPLLSNILQFLVRYSYKEKQKLIISFFNLFKDYK
jgi:hypothetical protein